MQTGSVLTQGGPTHYRQHHSRHHRAAPAQVGPSSSGRLHFGNLQHHESTATSLSVDFRLTTAERPVAYRNGLEHAYTAGIGGPHNRRSVNSVISSLAALPASLPMPTGEDSERVVLKPLPRAVENVADDPSLHNPLARQERLSTGWFGVSTLQSIWPGEAWASQGILSHEDTAAWVDCGCVHVKTSRKSAILDKKLCQHLHNLTVPVRGKFRLFGLACRSNGTTYVFVPSCHSLPQSL